VPFIEEGRFTPNPEPVSTRVTQSRSQDSQRGTLSSLSLMTNRVFNHAGVDTLNELPYLPESLFYADMNKIQPNWNVHAKDHVYIGSCTPALIGAWGDAF